MPSLLLAAPAVVLSKLAWVSLRTGCDWTRHRQWDAVATHIAIGAVLGGMAAGLAVMAMPERG